MENTNNINDILKAGIKQEIEKEYDEYVLECLKNLETKLMVKKNDVVKSILNTIDINMEQNQFSLEPIIQIKINKTVKINK